MMRRALLIALLLVTGFCIGIAYATSFSETYDIATPAGSDDPAEADDRMREIKAAVQERMNICMYWPLTGTEVSDADAGEIRFVLFHAPIATTPTVAADHGDLRIKDVDSKAELTWTDEDENELVLTSKGNNLANDTFLTATDNAGTGSVELIKADVNDVAVLPENTILTPGVTPDANDEIVNKKYVDDQIQSYTNLGAWVNKSADYGAQQASTDGFVMVYGGGATNSSIAAYTDANANPSTQRGAIAGSATADWGTICMPVKSGEYWKVTKSASESLGVFWIPLGG